MTKTEACLSITDQVNGRRSVAKVRQALTHTKLSERIGEARALSCPKLCRHIVYSSYGFTVTKPCERVVDGRYGFVMPDSCAGVSLTVAMALSYQIAVRAYC